MEILLDADRAIFRCDNIQLNNTQSLDSSGYSWMQIYILWECRSVDEDDLCRFGLIDGAERERESNQISEVECVLRK